MFCLNRFMFLLILSLNHQKIFNEVMCKNLSRGENLTRLTHFKSASKGKCWRHAQFLNIKILSLVCFANT